MERVPQIGDIVRVSSPNGDFKLFTVNNVTPTSLLLQDLMDSGIKLELVANGGPWIVPNTNIRYNIDIIDQITLTGVQEIDVNILLQLDDDTLEIMCYDKNNKYTGAICNNNYFWTQKIKKIFPRFPIPEQYDGQHKILYDKIRAFTLQDIFNWAIEEGHLRVLRWLVRRGINNYNSDSIKTLIIKGYIHILKWLSEGGLEPTIGWANLAAGYNHLNILDWLAEQGIYPNVRGANLTAWYGRVAIMEWLLQHKIYPDHRGVSDAVKGGHLILLKLLAQHNIYPDFRGANFACKNRHLEVLKWLAEHNIYPNVSGANALAQFPNTNPLQNDLEILDWLAAHDIVPNQVGANEALINNNTNMINWLAQHEIFPDQQIIDNYMPLSRDSIVILMSYDIYPSQQGVDLAAYSQDIDMLELLAQHNIYPSQTAADRALTDGHLEVLQWLVDHGIRPH